MKVTDTVKIVNRLPNVASWEYVAKHSGRMGVICGEKMEQAGQVTYLVCFPDGSTQVIPATCLRFIRSM